MWMEAKSLRFTDYEIWVSSS